ncbi:MAG: hypothetical protein IJV35_07525 [Neisseriaceae bacterium]|nr:hypothetical protein [Neisseriaceae bacterium]
MFNAMPLQRLRRCVLPVAKLDCHDLNCETPTPYGSGRHSCKWQSH